MSPTGIDQAWGYADPKAAKRAGVQVVSMYLSWDSSKNATPKKIKGYHAQGIGALLNWESQAGAPLNGASQGRVDATEASRQARALIAGVGYRPGNRPVIYFSCDADVGSGQIAGPIRAYYEAAAGICHAAGFGVGCYGEADLVHYLAANKITDAEWQTLAWSGGRVDPAADFYQSSINNTLGGASVDFDQVIHADQLGAWWPPSSPHNVQEDDMSATDVQQIRADIAALSHKVDLVAPTVWKVPLTSRVDGKAYSAATFATSTHLFATRAAQSGAAAAVNTAAVAADITSRVRDLLAGLFTGSAK